MNFRGKNDTFDNIYGEIRAGLLEVASEIHTLVVTVTHQLDSIAKKIDALEDDTRRLERTLK